MSTLIHTIKLSGECVFSAPGTWTFMIDGGSDTPGILLTPSPAQTLSFEVDWGVDPIQDQDVTVDYLPAVNPLEAIQKAPLDGEDLMDAFTFTLTNCQNPTSTVGIIESWTGEEGCGTVTLKHNLITLTHLGQTLVHTRA